MAAVSRPTAFRYKVIQGRWSPMVSLGLWVAQAWRPVELYIDSGATYTILRAKVAEDVGFDYEQGRKVFVQVRDGALIPVFLHKLPLQIGGDRMEADVGFSAKLGVPFNLLGRYGVFEHFRICFHEKRRVVTFQTM